MAVQVVLVLISVFFTEGLALRCQQCRSHSQSCSSQGCSYECSSISIATNLGGVQVEYNVRTCLEYTFFCVKGRINTGFVKATINSKCCRTDNCNDQSLPALPKQYPNGKKCCTNSDCSKTVKCEGDEDHCINGTVVVPDFKVALKGCATKSVCDMLTSMKQPEFPVTADAKCCEGNLCNGVSNIAMSINLLLTLGSLPCSILFL